MALYTTSDEDIKRMLEAATAVKENSYSPYSHFRVGACILCKDGSIYAGTNVENASYPAGTCAERGAIMNAFAHGAKGEFVSILLTSDQENEFISPCGFCRQALVEFGNLEVIMTNKKGELKRLHLMTDLLPLAFTPAALTA